jgi:hypothetical protein
VDKQGKQATTRSRGQASITEELFIIIIIIIVVVSLSRRFFAVLLKQ